MRCEEIVSVWRHAKNRNSIHYIHRQMSKCPIFSFLFFCVCFYLILILNTYSYTYVCVCVPNLEFFINFIHI